MHFLVGKIVKEVVLPDEVVPDYLKIVFADGSELEVMASVDGNRSLLDTCMIEAIGTSWFLLWKNLKSVFSIYLFGMVQKPTNSAWFKPTKVD